MKKVIQVEVAELLRHEPDCIMARAIGDDSQKYKGCRIEVAGPSSVVFDDDREMGSRVWVETVERVTVTNSKGEKKVIE